jgi:hypothetical protein
MKGIKGINKSVIPEDMPEAWLSGIYFKLMYKRQKLSLAEPEGIQRESLRFEI